MSYNMPRHGEIGNKEGRWRNYKINDDNVHFLFHVYRFFGVAWKHSTHLLRVSYDELMSGRIHSDSCIRNDENISHDFFFHTVISLQFVAHQHIT